MRLVLEQRYLFDGSAAATGAHAFGGLHHHGDHLHPDGAPGQTEFQHFHPTELPAPPAIAEPHAALSGSPETVLFVDPRVTNWQSLTAGVKSNVEVVVLDPNASGIAQVTQALSNLTNVKNVEFLTDGTPGSITLGGTTLDMATLSANTGAIAGVERAPGAQCGHRVLGLRCRAGQCGCGVCRRCAYADRGNGWRIVRCDGRGGPGRRLEARGRHRAAAPRRQSVHQGGAGQLHWRAGYARSGGCAECYRQRRDGRRDAQFGRYVDGDGRYDEWRAGRDGPDAVCRVVRAGIADALGAGDGERCRAVGYCGDSVRRHVCQSVDASDRDGAVRVHRRDDVSGGIAVRRWRPGPSPRWLPRL